MNLKFLALLNLCLWAIGVNAQTIEVVTQERSKGIINQLKYSQDGTLLASGSKDDHSVKVWDIKSGKIIGTLDAHEAIISTFEFSPNGKKMLSSSQDGKLVLWDIVQWEIIDSLTLDSPVSAIKFKDNNIILVGNQKGGVFQLDVNNITLQDKLHDVKNEVAIMDVYQEKLIIGTKTGHASYFDLDSKVEKVEKRIHIGEIIGLKFYNQGAEIVSAGHDGVVHFWNLSTLEESKHIRVSTVAISAFDANESKDIIVFANKNKSIFVLNFKGEELNTFKAKTEELNHQIHAVALAPDGSTIASSNYRRVPSINKKINESLIQVWDLRRGILYKMLQGEVDPFYSFDFNPTQNRLITLGDDRKVTFWDFEAAEKYGDITLMEPKREVPPIRKMPKGKDAGSKFLKIATSIANGNLPDVDLKNTGKNVGSAIIKRAFKEKSMVKYSSKGNYMITKLEKDEIRLYSLEDRKPEYVKPLFSYQPNINNFMTSPDESKLVVLGSGDSAISIIDLKSGDFERKLSTPAPVGNAKYLYEGESMAFSPDGSLFAVCFNTGKVFVYSTYSWRLVFENALPNNIGYVNGAFVNFSENGEYIIINTILGVVKYNIIDYTEFKGGILETKGVSIPIDKPSDYAVTVHENRLYFENVLTGDITESIRVKPKDISKVSVKKDGKLGVSTISGQFLLIDPKTGEIEILLVSNGDNYIFKTHENYYKVTKDGFDLVTYRIGNKAFPFEQFDAVFNRPDIVLEKLQSQDADLISLYKKAYEKRIKKLGINVTTDISLSSIPECEVTNVVDIPAITEKTHIKLNFKLKDKKALQSYNVWVNNVPVYGKIGSSISGKKELTSSESVELVYGLNKIQISAKNTDGYESLIQTFYVEKSGEQPKPNLYIATIGASKYKSDQYNLNYPTKDAADLTKLMSANANGLYGEVKTKSLNNDEVTVENVLALKSFLMEAGINDVVLVFVAGHGVLDANFDYYFATYDMDFNHPEGRGLAYDQLESIIDGIKAKRKILIMDTCHSGEIDKEEAFFSEEDEQEDEEVSFRSAGPSVGTNESSASPSKVMSTLFNDLRKGTGATVLSSAGGAEYAMESSEWKNGLFTYCLLMGLKNGKADINEDGTIKLIELQTYVTEKVKALSHGKQIPNTRIQNLELDFRIW